MNKYKTAIDKNEIPLFFRGKGEYYYPDRDREGVHNIGAMSFVVMGYGTEYGEEELYSQLNGDLNEYIDLGDFNLGDLTGIFGIIWTYHLFRKEDNLFKNDWLMSYDLLEKIKIKIELFEEKGEDLSNIFRVLKNLRERFGFIL